VLVAASPAAAREWTPRQVRIIKAANEVIESVTWAYPNSCKVTDGKARFAAAKGKLEAMVPALEKELGAWAVHEIFILRAPTFGPGAHPPAKCKKLKRIDPGKEAAMARYEKAVAALAATVEAP
jgi:hypothetical protein